MKYTGTELEIFSHAINWKDYWSTIISFFIKGSVLEVGAGIGSSTIALSSCKFKTWTCLEPDPELVSQLKQVLDSGLSSQYKVITGTIGDVKPGEYYDTILYIDVLEHIEDDRLELQNATRLLSDGGNLVILAPAHQWLFSEFDKSIGHYRRYNKTTLMEIIPDELELIKNYYLDSVGLFSSLGNRIFMHKKIPDKYQIDLWDKILVPCSRIADKLILYKFGKTVIGIWKKK